MRRVVVTGVGAVTALGHTVEDTWKAVCEGKSGIANVTAFDTSAMSVHFGGEIKDFNPDGYLLAKEVRKIDRFIRYGMVAGIQAMQNSELEVTDQNRHRIGVAMGSGIGGLDFIVRNQQTLENGGPRKVSPFLVPGATTNMLPGYFSIRYGMRGPNFSVTTACATATHNIGLGARLIRYGDADAMVVGGAEAMLTPLGLAGFCSARALSSRNDAPAEASRPWDKDRDGFVLSDGAGVLVLEEYESARARGANIYAELTGFGMSGDAYHITSPAEDGHGAKQAMLATLQDAKLNADKVDYINAHGTSTRVGDVAESQAIEAVMGGHADNIAVSSTKSMLGHSIGATGAIEAILSLLAIRDSVAPPTINLDNPDENCNLNYVPKVAQERTIKHVLSNSFGFGGTNCSLLFSHV